MIKTLRKVFYKLIGLNPIVDRFVRYRNPRRYWQARGGNGYFEEQEAVHNRTLRSQFIAQEIKQLSYKTLLEVGCGYGKQLKNLDAGGIFIAGCDFSHPQLLKAKEVCQSNHFHYVEADAENLPFQNKSFDLVLSSAVILHNEYEKAKKIISEIIRISRKYIVHNEDTDVTFSRYGYDLTKTYQKMNFKILKSVPIPCASDPSITQFTIVELPSPGYEVKPEDVPLAYH